MKQPKKILILNITCGCGNGKTAKFKFHDFRIDPTSREQEISLEPWSDNTAKALRENQAAKVPPYFLLYKRKTIYKLQSLL